MATKLNVGIDEELVRQMISGQTPPSTNVIRKSVSKEADNPPASVVAAPEDSSKPDSPPSGTVVSERQDVKPESAPVPDIRRRRSMTLPDYKKHFLPGWITTSAPRSMSVPLRNGKSLKS